MPPKSNGKHVCALNETLQFLERLFPDTC